MKILKIILILVSAFLINPVKAEIYFSDITDSSGIGDIREPGYGTAMLDFNRDGLQDIFVVGQHGGNRLFQNLGGLQFADVTDYLGVRGSGAGWGVCYGDFDADGFEDIYISRRDAGQNDFFVYSNGSYFESAAQFDVQDLGGYGYAACFAPLTKNLTLDLIVINQAWSGNQQSCRFFANHLGGVFTNMTEISGLADSSQYWDAASLADFDNDKDLDLFVSGESTNRLYRNNGNGIFTNISDSARINLPRDGDTTGYGVAWGDYNNDGRLDYYVTNWHDQTGELYRQNRNGTFTNVTESLGLGLEWWSHSVSFADFDNDGWLDLYTVSAGSGNKLYRNNQGMSFSEIAGQAGVADGHYGCGLSIGDLDSDGRLDMVVGHYANAGDNPPKISIYHNLTINNNHWIEIIVNGFSPNLDAIGARVRIVAGGISQIREVSGGSGFGSQNMLPLHFGLGSATRVDSLIITYPVAHIPPLVYEDLDPDQGYELPDVDLDLASVAIESPNEPTDCGQPIQPQLKIVNAGNLNAVNFRAFCELSYDSTVVRVDTMEIQSLGVGDTLTLTFEPEMLPHCERNYHIKGMVRISGDLDRNKDTVSVNFYAGRLHDIACGPIFNPRLDSLLLPILPTVGIRNMGITIESGIHVYCNVANRDSVIYAYELVYDEVLPCLGSDTLIFPEFRPIATGNYRFSFATQLNGDMNASNDSASLELDIEGGDCHYTPGDINASGLTNYVDVVYAVSYFRGGPPPPNRCFCPPHGDLYINGDVNGSCTFDGSDISYMVRYFHGNGELMPCPDCPPVLSIKPIISPKLSR
jgi:enediyne biosynthesis protein E4